MENNHVLELAAVSHHDPRVRRVGFELSHPYVEQVYGAVIGPSGVMLLRRLPVLWREHEPARIPLAELARMLGLGTPSGNTRRLERALDRIAGFHLARWAEPGQALEVYTEVPPARGRLLTRLPEWSRQAHDRLLGAHLDGLVGSRDRELEVSGVKARLDRLQRADAPGLGPVPVIGR
jgi:hypothetical protein